MTLLMSHLEQISASAKAIGDLSFPQPKAFTNAILGDHEITALIRDTEPHERALFSTAPSAQPQRDRRRSTRRTTGFGSEDIRGTSSFFNAPRQQSAVARVLGRDMLEEIEAYKRTSKSSTRTGGVNIEVLLRGAEKLCNVYSVPGAVEKIALLRHRHRQVAESVALYEARVTEQAAQLDVLTQNNEPGFHNETQPSAEAAILPEDVGQVVEDDLRAEEEEIAELEQKKRSLEERVSSMEKDLGGLLR